MLAKERCKIMKIGSILKRKKGLTFVETAITAAVVAILMVSVIKLLGNIYAGILASNLKSNSYNLAASYLEGLKKNGFAAINVTDDSCLTNLTNPNLTTLASYPTPTNPYPVTIIATNGVPFNVYQFVTYAQTDSNGNLSPMYSTGLTYTPAIKMASVIVTYRNSNMIKNSQVTSYIANQALLGSCTSTISGQICLYRTGWWGNWCRAIGGWWGWRGRRYATVYIQGYPGLQGNTDTNGNYKIWNVPPDNSYFLFASGPGLFTTPFSSNPFDVEAVCQDYTGVNISVAANTTCISGYLSIYLTPNIQLTPCAGKTPIQTPTPQYSGTFNGASITANDGFSDPSLSGNALNCMLTPVTTNGFYALADVNPPAAGKYITVSAVYSSASYNYYGSQVVSIAPNQSLGLNLTLTYVPASTSGTVNIYVKSALDDTTLITDPVTVYFIPTSSSTNGGQNVTSTANSGLCSAFMPVGTYNVTGAAPNYIIYSPIPPAFTLGSFIYNDPNPIYLMPIGKISGIITDYDTGNLIPNIPVQVISNGGSGSLITTAQTDSTGTYLAVSIPAVSNGYKVAPVLSSTNYSCINPTIGYYGAVMVQQGVTTSNIGFTLKITSQPIQGQVTFNSTPVAGGVMILAVPSGTTTTPDQFYWSMGTGSWLQSQDSMVRLKFPRYGAILQSNSYYSFNVPAGTTYDLYAYYSYLTPPRPLKVLNNTPTPVVNRYYQKISNVSPNTTQNFSGPWQSY